MRGKQRERDSKADCVQCGLVLVLVGPVKSVTTSQPNNQLQPPFILFMCYSATDLFNFSWGFTSRYYQVSIVTTRTCLQKAKFIIRVHSQVLRIPIKAHPFMLFQTHVNTSHIPAPTPPTTTRRRTATITSVWLTITTTIIWTVARPVKKTYTHAWVHKSKTIQHLDFYFMLIKNYILCWSMHSYSYIYIHTCDGIF